MMKNTSQKVNEKIMDGKKTKHWWKFWYHLALWHFTQKNAKNKMLLKHFNKTEWTEVNWRRKKPISWLVVSNKRRTMNHEYTQKLTYFKNRNRSLIDGRFSDFSARLLFWPRLLPFVALKFSCIEQDPLTCKSWTADLGSVSGARHPKGPDSFVLTYNIFKT